MDETFAKEYWPSGNVLGARVREARDPPEQWHTIVGVAPAVKQSRLDEAADKGTIYWDFRQRPAFAPRAALTVRTALPPERMTRAVEAAIHRVDPGLALFDVRSMDARVAQALGPQRTPMVLTLLFAAVAFTLAVVGIYAVLAWTVTQRVGEIGVRVALGADDRRVVGMVLRQGGRLTLIGIAFGSAAAIGLGRLLASQLPGVSAADPLVLGVATVGLAAAALLASWIPARRAARIDPLRALREE